MIVNIHIFCEFPRADLYVLYIEFLLGNVVAGSTFAMLQSAGAAGVEQKQPPFFFHLLHLDFGGKKPPNISLVNDLKHRKATNRHI